jgi:hypothetical protein
MGTTTNNNWPTPVASDLVKDGWEAIKDLGDAIDTTLGVYSPATPMGVHLSTVAFSGVSALSINNCFSATYRHYKILIDYDLVSSTFAFIRLRASGSDDTAANYAYNLSGQNTDNRHTVNGAASFFAVSDTSSSGYCPLWIELMNPFETANTFITTSQWLDNAQTITAGAKQTTTSYDGFSFISNSGNFESKGKIQVYGYNQ